MYGDFCFGDEDDKFAGGNASSPDKSTAPSATGSPSVVSTGDKTTDGQNVLQGTFKLKKWYDGPGLTLFDTVNTKGYPVSLLGIPVTDKDDKKGVRTQENKCEDRVPQNMRVKGVDTFGTYASIKHMANVREVGSIGHIRMLSEKGFPIAYPVQTAHSHR